MPVPDLKFSQIMTSQIGSGVYALLGLTPSGEIWYRIYYTLNYNTLGGKAGFSSLWKRMNMQPDPNPDVPPPN